MRAEKRATSENGPSIGFAPTGSAPRVMLPFAFATQGVPALAFAVVIFDPLRNTDKRLAAVTLSGSESNAMIELAVVEAVVAVVASMLNPAVATPATSTRDVEKLTPSVVENERVVPS